MHGGHNECRFDFPIPSSEQTQLKTEADKGHRSRIYILKRTEAESMANAYYRPILLAWGANMDIQQIGSAHGAAHYVTSYVIKEEAADVRKAVDGV